MVLVAYCLQRWPGDGKVLLVIDDVQDYAALKPMMPGSARFRILLTTRQAILSVGQRLALAVLTPEAALALLTRLVGPERIGAAPGEAAALCGWVGRLPLGIELLGRYLEQRPAVSLATLRGRLEEKRLDAKALVETHPEMTATLGVAAAFEVSWEGLSAGAKTLAVLLGLFAAAPLDWEWAAAASQGAGLEDEAVEEGQRDLLLGSWLQPVKREQAAAGYQVHPLVREFFAVKGAEWAGGEALQRGFAEAMTAVAKTIGPMVIVSERERVAGAVPHLEEVAQQWTQPLDGIDKTWCCTGLAWFYQSLNLWAEAERCYLRSLEISKAELGERHPDTASSLNSLAVLYQSQGRYGEAEPLLRQALDICKAELGERHPDTAGSLFNLAALYHQTQRPQEALAHIQQALAIYVPAFGPDHPHTQAALSWLQAIEATAQSS